LVTWLVSYIVKTTKRKTYDKKGIEIPFPRQVVYLRREKK